MSNANIPNIITPNNLVANGKELVILSMINNNLKEKLKLNSRINIDMVEIDLGKGLFIKIKVHIQGKDLRIGIDYDFEKVMPVLTKLGIGVEIPVQNGVPTIANIIQDSVKDFVKSTKYRVQ